MLEPRHTVTNLVPVHYKDPSTSSIVCTEWVESVIAEGSKEAMEAVRRLMKLPDGPVVFIGPPK